MKSAIAQDKAYATSTKHLADLRQKLGHVDKLTATAREEHEAVGVQLGTMKNDELGASVVEQKLQQRENAKEHLNETKTFREEIAKSMEPPEYLTVAQHVHVGALIMERDIKAAALEVQRKNVVPVMICEIIQY